LNILKLLLYRM